MNKKMLAVIGAFAPVALFAEGTAGEMDTTAASGIIQKATTGLGNLLTTVTPFVTNLILAGLAIWAALVIIKLVKRAFSRAG